MPGDFDTIKERVDIVSLISERVPLKKAGKVYKGVCPFHIEKTASLQVDPERRNYHCFGCLPPGTFVKTSNGPRPIDAIEVDDEVFGKDGRLHRVVRTHEHFFRGDLVSLTCAPFKIPVLLTPDHMVPVLRPRSGRLEEVPAGLLKPGNYLVYPLIERPPTSVDWKPLSSWLRRYGPHPKPLPLQVDTLLLAEWLGWYLAEGSVSNDRSVRFSLGQDEAAVADRLCQLTDLLFDERPRVTVRDVGIELWFCHALLARWLKHNCGDGAKNKRLPDFVWGWERELQQTLVAALVAGDGRTTGETVVAQYGFRSGKTWHLNLASVRLIDEVRDLLLRIGTVAAMRERHEDDGRCSWSLGVSDRNQGDWARAERADGLLPIRIRRIGRVPYDGPVYNLTVADEHSFLTLSGAVANCGKKGDIFTFLEELDHIDRAESLRILAERAGVDISRRSPEEREREDRLRKVMGHALFYFRQGLRSPEHGKAAAAYLAKRGMTPEFIDQFGLGYAPDLWDGLLGYIKKKGYTEDDGVSVGLLRVGDRGGAYDWFRGRLMVPIRDSRGRVIAFGGRAMRADQQAKYMNSPNTALFNKSATLYALDAALPSMRSEGTAVIVEGYFDVIASHQAGITNVVASMGTALTAEQYVRLQELKLEKVVVAFDGDLAGQVSAERRGRELLPLLQRHGGRAGSGQVGTRGYATLYVTVLPEGMDPDDLARSDPARLRDLIDTSQSLLDFLIAKIRERSVLSNSEGRVRFLREVADVLAAEPDPVRREAYLTRVAQDTGVDPAVVRTEIEGAMRRPRPATGSPASQPQAGNVRVRGDVRPATASGAVESSPMKQTPLQERYVMALLTRFPEEIARVDLDPDDLVDPDLRALLIHLQAGDRPLSDLPAHLAATVAALSASAQGPSEEADPGQAIEIAVQRLRVQRLRDRLEQVRAELASAKDEDLQELALEVDRLAQEMTAAMARVERRTVLHGETERKESE